MFPSNRVNIVAAITAAAVVIAASASAGFIACCQPTARPGAAVQTVLSSAVESSHKESEPPRQAVRYAMAPKTAGTVQSDSSAAPSESETPQVSSTASDTKTAYFPLTAAQRDKIERIVMASCGELDSNMSFGNAQVILDRIKSGKFGSTIDEVLDAPHQFEAPWKGEVNNKVKNAVSAVFDRGERVTDTKLYYYVNPHLSYISPTVWSRDKRYIITLGHGKFIHQYWTDK